MASSSTSVLMTTAASSVSSVITTLGSSFSSIISQSTMSSSGSNSFSNPTSTSFSPTATMNGGYATTVVYTATHFSELDKEAISSLEEHMHFLFIQTSIMLTMLLVALNLGGILHKIDFKYIRETALYLIMGIRTRI